MREPRPPAMGTAAFDDILLSVAFLFLSMFFFLLSPIYLQSRLMSRAERGHEGRLPWTLAVNAARNGVGSSRRWVWRPLLAGGPRALDERFYFFVR